MKLDEFEKLCNKATRDWESGYVPVDNHVHWRSIGPVTFGLQQSISDAAFTNAARDMAPKMIRLIKLAQGCLACDDPIITPGKWDVCDICPACHFFKVLAELGQP